MDKRELYKSALYDSHRNTAEMMVVAVGGDPENFHVLYELAFSEKYPMNMRCANVCRHCCELNPELIFPYLDELPEKIEQNTTDGVKRSFLKIYASRLSENDFRNLDKLTDLCFQYISDVRQALAVRAYCMDIAYKLCLLEPDLMNELLSIAYFEQESPFAAMQSKAHSIIKKLKKENNRTDNDFDI
jgi:hypothetical protein